MSIEGSTPRVSSLVIRRQPNRSFPLRPGEFASSIWQQFDAKTAVDAVFRSKEFDSDAIGVIQSALYAWVIAPKNRSLVRESIIRETYDLIFSAVGRAIKHHDLLRDADAAAIASFSDTDFVKEIYESIGGLRSIRGLETDRSLLRKLNNHAWEKRASLIFVELAHMQLEQPFSKGRELAAEKASEVVSKFCKFQNTRRLASIKEGKPNKRFPGDKHPERVQRDFAGRSKSIALAYAASTISTAGNSDLLYDIANNRIVAQDDCKRWLQRARFVADKILPIYKRLGIASENAAPLTDIPATSFMRKTRPIDDESKLNGLIVEVWGPIRRKR